MSEVCCKKKKSKRWGKKKSFIKGWEENKKNKRDTMLKI